MIGTLVYWFALLVSWLIEHFHVSFVDIKAFMNGLPVGFWTVFGTLITAAVAMFTLAVTQTMNLHSMERQAENQNKILSKQLSHQKETAYMQYFLDKRTSAVLEFQNRLEDAKGILVYFKSEHADLARRKALGVKYNGNVHAKKFVKINVYHETQVEKFLEVSLAQIEPMQEKINELKKAFNIMSIFLEKNETSAVYELVTTLEKVQDFIVGTLKGIESRDDMEIYRFIHANDSLSGFLKEIDKKHVPTREILKKYLYLHKLDA